jgi:hypothetical protein
MEAWMKWLIGVGIVLALAFLFYCFFLNHVDINEIGIAYNSIGGKVWIQDRPGWYLTSPFVEIATVTTLPLKVTIPSEAKVINTKIVRFNPAGVDEFIRMQGFSYFSNQGLENILMGYAFSGEKYSFLEVMQENSPERVNTTPVRR